MTERRFSPAVGTAAVLALGAIVCSLIWTRALVRVRSGDEMIRVVGSARKSIRSDFIIWRGSITENAANVSQGYASLQAKTAKVTAYLRAKGIAAADIAPSAINVTTLYMKTKPTLGPDGTPIETNEPDVYRPIAGYRLTQSIEVRSGNVALVDGIARQSTELISQGVVLESHAPLYLYTKLSELKVSMQAEAARDARNRAEQIAANAGCRLGAVRFARMQVPQITPLYATQESDGGVDDTSSLDKKITAIVVAGYAIR